MQFETLTVSLENHIATVRLNRPDKANAMNAAMWQEIRQAFQWVDATPEARVAVLQSLLRERDLAATLTAVHRVLRPGGSFGVELVADLPSWAEYQKRVSLKGWRDRPGGAHVTLVETVRQDPARHLTIFDQEFTERRGTQSHSRRFALTFRTLSVPQMARRLEKAGFEITAMRGDYRGGPWSPDSEVWIIMSRRPYSNSS